jgi:hypothetical protein
MLSALIGLAAGLLTIFTFRLIKGVNEITLYGLMLSGIGFIYVGFTWSSWEALSVNVLQAMVFAFFAYLGIKKSNKFIIAGYFLHGVWDLSYSLFFSSSLIPPHYDLFCLAFDFTVGFYLMEATFRKVRERALAGLLQTQN